MHAVHPQELPLSTSAEESPWHLAVGIPTSFSASRHLQVDQQVLPVTSNLVSLEKKTWTVARNCSEDPGSYKALRDLV